ncbi:tail fiber protein [Aeromonas caviae]
MADLKGYVTAVGQNFEALAKQMGYTVQIGTIEIGDGVLPDSESPIARTNLVNKLKSFPAILEIDPVNPGQFIVSCNIPADDAINGAGYFIREMGCRLAGQGAGTLYAYRRISNDFKPLITQGEAKSFIYKLRFIPSNGELLTPVIDPSTVLASVEYCDNKIASELAKRDHKQSVRAATTGDIALSATQTIDGVVLAVGDRVLVKDQADAKQNGLYLVAAQAWTRTTDADTGTDLTSGARIYVEEGTVNGTKAWYLATAGAIILGTTQLQFKDEHPAATKTVAGVMRLSTLAEALAGVLDDVAVTPKSALEMAFSAYPVGAPIPWPQATPPSGFLMMQGQSFSAATYPKLAQAYTSLVLPDLRGEFMRGWDNGRGVDAGRALLSAQLDAVQDATGTVTDITTGPNTGGVGVFSWQTLTSGLQPLPPGSGYYQKNLHFNLSNVCRTSTETRARNIAFNYIVRAA